jgi:hypothetical protein
MGHPVYTGGVKNYDNLRQHFYRIESNRIDSGNNFKAETKITCLACLYILTLKIEVGNNFN